MLFATLSTYRYSLPIPESVPVLYKPLFSIASALNNTNETLPGYNHSLIYRL